MRPRAISTILLIAATWIPIAYGDETATSVPSSSPVEAEATDELDNLSKAEILKMIRDLSDELKQTRSELRQMKEEREAVRTRPVPQFALTPPAPRTTSPSTEPVSPSVPVEAPQEKTEAEKETDRLERERAIRSVQRSGVLLQKGKFEMEPSFTYSHYSSNLIDVDGFAILPVLVVGEIQSIRIERDIFQTALNLRYGLWNNLQADVVVPFRHEENRLVRQAASQSQQVSKREETREDQGIGDVQFGLSYQLLHEHGWVPDLILSSVARAPTGKSQFDLEGSTDELPQGSGVWGVRTGITAIKSLDPAVLIFNVGYTHNFGKDFTVQQVTASSTNKVSTSYIPGGAIDVGVSVAIAMNPSFAINLGIVERYTSSTELDGIGTVEGSSLNEAEIRFGFSWALTRNSALNFTAAAGLTEDTPDFTTTLSVPFKF